MVLHGAGDPGEVPGLERAAAIAEFRCASDLDALRRHLPGADALLGWNFRATDLREAWPAADRLRWIQWAGAGVDAVLFPALVRSPVLLTNARGVFDRAMAEYVLGLVCAFAKGFVRTFEAQRARRWDYRTSELLHGRRVLIVGAGSIGRAIARALAAAGLQVTGVGRRRRDDDPDFGVVEPVARLPALLPEADYVVLIAPLTADTRGLFGAPEFAAMHRGARFINVGRGELVDESALLAALASGAIAGAALDVFTEEPLAQDSPLWAEDNLIVSPHMSGDFAGHRQALADLFLDNLARFHRGEPLCNLVDKRLGFAAPEATT